MLCCCIDIDCFLAAHNMHQYTNRVKRYILVNALYSCCGCRFFFTHTYVYDTIIYTITHSTIDWWLQQTTKLFFSHIYVKLFILYDYYDCIHIYVYSHKRLKGANIWNIQLSTHYLTIILPSPQNLLNIQ